MARIWGKRGMEVIDMQRCTFDMQTEEEEKEAPNICSSSDSCKCSGASSIPSTSKEAEEDKDEEEDGKTAGCIMPKAQERLTQCSYNDSSFLLSCGNVPSCVAARCTMAGKTFSGASLIMPISKQEDADKDGENAGCVTPKANEHRIPHPLACPPPPHKKLKKHKSDQILASPFDAGHGTAKPKVLNNFYDYTTHNFFNPPLDLHTYPECIKALFKS